SVLLNADATEIEVTVHARALPDGCGVTLVFTDLSRHLQTERVLRKTLLEQQATLENASIGIIFTKSRLVQGINPCASEMFGYSDASGIGQATSCFFSSGAAYDEVTARARPLLGRGKPFQEELELRRQDDTTLWGQLIGYLLNPQDPLQGTTWIIEDRTEQ